MDQSTKQRLVGAVVLVAAVLWIVPVFLDGPSDDQATISETVELPGAGVTPPEQRTIELGAEESPASPAVVDEPTVLAAPSAASDANTPVPSETATRSPEPADETRAEPTKASPSVAKAQPETSTATPEPPPRETKPEPRAQPVATAPAPTSAAGELWAVQLGSFSERENASRLAAELRKKGVTAFLAEVEQDGRTLHRVRVGPVKDRPAAEQLAAKLGRDGHNGRVVPHP